MNTYKISGADRTTGVERTVVLEAADDKAATIAASKDHNLLVSKMRLVPPPKIGVASPTANVGSMEYAGPSTPAAVAMPAIQPTHVVEHVHRFEWHGLAMEILGAGLLLAGAVALAFAAIDYSKFSESKNDLASGLAFRFAMSGATSGLSLVGVGAICLHLSRSQRRGQ